MLTLKVLSALLSYPESEVLEAQGEMQQAVEREHLFRPGIEARVLGLLSELAEADLIELQERYVALFDRGRSLSLHIFEHVHGESRDRGQAMVALLDEYQRNGFLLDAPELPDYIPLFLEYLAHRPLAEAQALLRDAMPVLSLLGARLGARGSPYRVLFEALEDLAGAPEDVEEIRARAAAEGPDETIVNMDRIWEEEAVTFMADPGGCNPSEPAAAPLRWVESAAAPASGDP